MFLILDDQKLVGRHEFSISPNRSEATAEGNGSHLFYIAALYLSMNAKLESGH